MLQFAIGLSYINISWLLGESLGATVYNAPPLAFIAVIALLGTGFYSFKLKGEMIRFVLLIGTLGVASAFLHGITFWHVRQILAFAAAATIWVFLYQEASRRDIFTMSRTQSILNVYFVFAILALTEKLLSDTAGLAYLVGSVFSFHPDAIVDYVVRSSGGPRFSYFSNEPSSAAYAIAAVIFPYVCAKAVTERTIGNLVSLGFACFVMYLAEGMTSRILILYSLGFVIAPRLAVMAVPGIMAVLGAVILSLVPLLNDRQALIQFLLNTFGGITGRIDIGLESGSYLSRLGTWFIGAKTFLQDPILGQGFGGTAANFFALANQGYDVLFTAEQRNFYYNDMVPSNSQMIFRIPAELGLVGVSICLFYARRALKFVFVAPRGDRLSYYAFLYALGAMLLSFNLTSEYFNPMIAAFVVLLAQMLRKEREASEAPAPIALLAPPSNGPLDAGLPEPSPG